MAHLEHGLFWSFYICPGDRVESVVIPQQKRLVLDDSSNIVAKSILAPGRIFEGQICGLKGFIDFGMAELEKITAAFGVKILGLEARIKSAANT